MHETREVFTPTKPARLAFVERKTIQNRLVDALRTPGKQVIVYGHSGSGKTTLLVNKLHQVYSCHITTRCMFGMDFDQLLLDGFDQLNKFYEQSYSSESKKTISASLSGEYLNLKSKIESSQQQTNSSKIERIVPPQLTPQRLAKFLGEAGCCWVLEDFHKIEEQEKKKLSQAMKVFMDMADEYSDVKVVAIGAVGTAREVVAYDHEMRNRVAEIYVPLMEDREILEILDKGFGLLNINSNPRNNNSIAEYSNGLASVAHQLALNSCSSAGIYETLAAPFNMKAQQIEEAVTKYIEEESDTIKHAFDKALKRKRGGKYDNCRIILRALAKIKSKEGVGRADLMQQIRKEVSDYPEGNLSRYLKELTTQERGEIVRYSENSGLYAYSNPFHRAFAIALLSRISNDSSTSYQLKLEFKNTGEGEKVLNAINAALKNFLEATQELNRTKR